MKAFAMKTAYLEAIRRGEKTATVRLEGGLSAQAEVGGLLTFTNYKPGATVRARCTDVRHETVSALTEDDARADGFASLDELLTALRKHYPTLRATTRVCVIRFCFEKDSAHNAAATR